MKSSGFDLFVDLFAAHAPVVGEVRRRHVRLGVPLKVYDLPDHHDAAPEENRFLTPLLSAKVIPGPQVTKTPIFGLRLQNAFT
jgi:hypothetical protein